MPRLCSQASVTALPPTKVFDAWRRFPERKGRSGFQVAYLHHDPIGPNSQFEQSAEENGHAAFAT